MIALCGAIYYFHTQDKRDKEKSEKAYEESQKARLTNDDYVIEKLVKFENTIIQYHSLPDAVRHKDAHVFRFLMKPWFLQLIAQYRHNESQAIKLRQDMLEYMDCLKNSRTAGFLALEGKESNRESRQLEEEANVNKYKIIENSFAQMIGAAAQKELREVRESRDWDQYSPDGTAAPPGYRYFLNDLVEDKRR